MSGPRIALIALYGECNALVPQSPLEAVRWMGFYRGGELTAALAEGNSFVVPELRSFCATLDANGPWTPLPILGAISASGPPFHESVFRGLLDEIDARLTAAGPVDGVYVCGHGAIRTEQTLDCEGTLYARLRDRVGPSVPIVGTLDLHGKISPQMAAMSDLLVSYRTNPHVDMAERGAEAAHAIARLLRGERPHVAHVRVPLLAPQTALDTRTGPFAPAVATAVAALADDDVATVGVLGGFALMDTPYNGVNVYVATWRDPALARSLATRLAESCWAARAATRAGYVPLEAAVATAVEAGADFAGPAVCIADISDNPGGGALGNTTFLLRALLDAGARGVALGPFWEPELAARAHAAGVGAVLDVELNAARVTELSASLPVQARVTALHPGRIRLGRGVGDGVELDHGPMAALEIGGVTLIVTTIAYQALSTAQFSELGIDIEAVRCFVLKSRGHFRAAFEGLIAPERILEVAVPGYTTPALDSVLLRNVQRPVYPLDPAMEWHAGDEVRVHVRGHTPPAVPEYRS